MVEYLDETTDFNGIKVRRIIEGNTKYWIPDPYFYGKKGHYLPFELPIFYNPLMEINRDLTLLATWAYINKFDIDTEKNLLFVEALAGSGIRGFRIINEVAKMNVILNDINPFACRFIMFNMRFFPPEYQDLVSIYDYDANFLLNLISRKRKSDIIVIDPFGTPAPFIDSAIRALKKREGLLLVTATDTAPLTGKFPNATLRKYGIYTYKTPFDKEIAVRTLISFIQRVAGKYSVALTPVFGFFINHFIKVGFISYPGKKSVDQILKRHGWVSIGGEKFDILERKEGNNGVIGPIWLNPIYDKEFVELMLKGLNAIPINKKNKEKLGRILTSENSSREILFYYNVELIASSLKRTTPKILRVVEELRKLGYLAERTHFDPKAIKTNANIETIKEIIKKL